MPAQTRQERDSGFPVTRMTNALPPDTNTASLKRTWWTDGVTWAGLVPAYVIKRMASAVALPLLICACQSSSAPNPSAHTSAGVTPSSVAGSWQTPSAREVTLGAVGDLAVNPQAVYALYTPAGTQGKLAGAINTMLARIDRASGIVHKAGPFPGALRIAVGGGSVWVGGSNQYPASPYPGAIGVVRLDPDSLKQLVSVALPGERDQRPLVAAVAASPGQVWLAYGRHLYQLDPKTGAVQSKQSLDGVAASITIDSKTSRLYVGSDAAANQTQATITEWGTATMRKLASDVTGGAGLGGPQIAAAGNDVWVAFATGMLGQVEHRRASDLSVLPTASSRYTNSVRVYIAGGFVWTTDGMANQLACLDPVIGAIRASTSLNLGGVVAGDTAGLYVGNVRGVDGLVPDPRCR